MISFVDSGGWVFVLVLNITCGVDTATLLQTSLDAQILPIRIAYTTMSRLTRKASAIQLLSLNAEQAQTEQQALHAEVNNLKDALKRSYTAYTMLRDDVERFKDVVRAQDVALRGLREEVASMRREIAAAARPPSAEKPISLVTEGRGVREHVRRR